MPDATHPGGPTYGHLLSEPAQVTQAPPPTPPPAMAKLSRKDNWNIGSGH